MAVNLEMDRMEDLVPMDDDVDEVQPNIQFQNHLNVQHDDLVDRLLDIKDGDLLIDNKIGWLKQLIVYNNLDVDAANIRLVAPFISKKGNKYIFKDENGEETMINNERDKQLFKPLKFSTMKGSAAAQNLLFQLGYVMRRGKTVKMAAEGSPIRQQLIAALQREAPIPALDQRELLGLEEAFTNIRDNIKLASGKIIRHSDTIEKLEKTIADLLAKPSIEDHEAELKSLRTQLKTEKGTLDLNMQLRDELKGQMKSQIDRLKDLYKLPLTERLQILFREEGVTVVSVLTAIAMTISTIVLAIGRLFTPPTPSAPTPQKNFVRQGLEKAGKALNNLAIESAKILPAIIGAIVSFILSTMGKVVSWAADH